MSRRASQQDAHNYLCHARDIGAIFDFQQMKIGRRTYFRIVTQPTHYAHYHDPDARGEILLTAREVYAFIEGVWAARGIQPVNRAGGRVGDAIREYQPSAHRTDAAGALPESES